MQGSTQLDMGKTKTGKMKCTWHALAKKWAFWWQSIGPLQTVPGGVGRRQQPQGLSLPSQWVPGTGRQQAVSGPAEWNGLVSTGAFIRWSGVTFYTPVNSLGGITQRNENWMELWRDTLTGHWNHPAANCFCEIFLLFGRYPSIAQKRKLQPEERNSVTPCQQKQSSAFVSWAYLHLEGFFPHKKHVLQDIKVAFRLGLEPETERQQRKISAQPF